MCRSILSLLIVYGLAIVAALPVSAQPKVAEIGTVISVEGTVTIESASEPAPVEVRQGDVVRSGDRLQTGEDGRVRVVMKDQSILVLGPKTTLDFSAFDYDQVRGSRAAVFNLLAGTLRAIVSKLKAYGNRFEIRTPTASIGVRGTHFIVEVDPETGETTVLVIEGRVNVANSDPAIGGQTLLGPMEQSEVRPDAPPSPAHVPSDDQLSGLREGTQVEFNPDVVAAVDPVDLPGPLTVGSPLSRQALLEDLLAPTQAIAVTPQARQDPTKGSIQIRW